MKRAIIYYSLSENTKEAAEYLAGKIGADLYRIEPVKPMPDSFKKQILLGGMQSSLGLTPKIKGVPANLADYEEILVGMPIWAGKPASPITTLIKKYPVADRITGVFTLSGGGDNDKCIAALQKMLPKMKKSVALVDRKHESAGLNREKLERFAEEQDDCE